MKVNEKWGCGMKLNSQIAQALHKRFNKGLKTKDAIGISLALHLLAGMAMTWFFVGTIVVTTPHAESSIEFDLISENANINSADQSDGQKLGKSSIAAKNAHGSAKNILDRQAVLMASMGDLIALKETFSFTLQQISSNSTGFSPLEGKIPDTTFYGVGQENQNGTGRGGFTFRVCAPSPHY